ncbi:MAG: helix-turn-helix domain-containing protein [Acidobacteriia bacterium]|nr:helix-turn-helix domain-containing protein [Terriglobia bacterium]
MMLPTHPKGLHNVGEFGDKFRKAREKKELSLDDVSNVTKIGTRMLQAIEEENFELLPGGVFNKGFIRAYAKHLGLDSEDAVNDYLACLRQAQVDSHVGWDATERRDPHAPVVTQAKLPRPFKPEVKVQEPLPVEELPELQLPRAEHIRPAKKEYLSRPSSGISWIRIAAAVCVLLSAFFLWTRHSRNNRTAGASSGSSVSSTTVSAAPAQSTPPSSSSAAPAPSASVPPAPTSTPSPRSSSESAQSSSETSPALNRAPAPVLPEATSTDPDEVKVEKKGDVTIRSFGSAGTKPPEKPAATLKLIVRATENSWISVTSDGQLVTQETLIAPAATSFHATRELVVRVGNAAGINFLWNGEDLPPQGAEAEAKTFIFDAQGMRTASPPQTPAQP